MGVYSKVVSAVKPINQIRAFVEGSAKDIVSGWVFVNGVRKQIFPTTDTWTEVYNNSTPGSYSTTLGWGKYKIELSGGGGSGGASSSAHSSAYNYANNGGAGKLFTAIINVAEDETRTISGIIGSGGKSSSARGYDRSSGTYSVGAAGTGANNGTKGTGQVKNTTRTISGGTFTTSAAAAGGSGGGSTSAVGIGTAAGGAGGSCRAENSAQQQANGTGGAGGSGSNQGNGASGGAGVYARDALATSGAGANGWVKIYKSGIYPA